MMSNKRGVSAAGLGKGGMRAKKVSKKVLGGAVVGGEDKKKKKKVVRKKRVPVELSLDGITDEQIDMLNKYFRERVIAWVEANCGIGRSKEARKDIRSKWRGYLKRSQAAGCYSNLIPTASTKDSDFENKERSRRREFTKFAFWMCKSKGTRKQIAAFAKYVGMRGDVMVEEEAAEELTENIHGIVERSNGVDDLIKDAAISNALAEIEVAKEKEIEKKAADGPARSTRRSRKMAAVVDAVVDAAVEATGSESEGSAKSKSKSKSE